MPALFVLKLEETRNIRGFVHMHEFDNGFLMWFDNMGLFTIERIVLEASKIFFLEYRFCSCKRM